MPCVMTFVLLFTQRRGHERRIPERERFLIETENQSIVTMFCAKAHSSWFKVSLNWKIVVKRSNLIENELSKTNT
jgi:hypothetical protein